VAGELDAVGRGGARGRQPRGGARVGWESPGRRSEQRCPATGELPACAWRASSGRRSQPARGRSGPGPASSGQRGGGGRGASSGLGAPGRSRPCQSQEERRMGRETPAPSPAARWGGRGWGDGLAGRHIEMGSGRLVNAE
jgi:hypothetical protein